MTSPLLATPGGLARARALGIPFDGVPGALSAITDVAGIEVGYSTILRGEGPLVVGEGPVRTGVTAILPRSCHAARRGLASRFSPAATASTATARSAPCCASTSAWRGRRSAVRGYGHGYRYVRTNVAFSIGLPQDVSSGGGKAIAIDDVEGDAHAHIGASRRDRAVKEV